jgi:hypothetical protein
MARQNAQVVALQAPTTNKFIEAQDMLCEATYVAEFLRGTICNAAELDSEFELSAAEAYGFANVLQNLIERIEKANTLLDEHAAEQQKAGGS